MSNEEKEKEIVQEEKTPFLKRIAKIEKEIADLRQKLKVIEKVLRK